MKKVEHGGSRIEDGEEAIDVNTANLPYILRNPESNNINIDAQRPYVERDMSALAAPHLAKTVNIKLLTNLISLYLMKMFTLTDHQNLS